MARKKPVTKAAETPAGSPVKRYVLIAVPLLVAVAAFFVIFWPKIQVTLWINGLHSDTAEIRRQMRDDLIEAAKKDPAVIDQIADAVGDDGRGFNVRQALVGILIQLNRTSTVLSTYENGSLPTRAVILSRLRREREFVEYWATDEAQLDVPGTIRRWLETTSGSLAYERSHAVQIAMQLEMADTMPLIRPMLTRVEANVHEDKKRDMLIAAAAAAEKFGDCDSLPQIATLAESDTNFLVRVRAIQNVYGAAFEAKAKCVGALPEERMQKLVTRALADETKEVRMAGMLILERRPEWAAGSAARLRQILEGDIPEGMQGTERRHALHALIGARDADFIATLPKYFFDPNPSIRSSCCHKTLLFKKDGPRLESCLIGIVRNEVESQSPFNAAMEALRRMAGKWYGFPVGLAGKAREGDRKVLNKAFADLFTTGEVNGTSRDDIVAAWFGWLCSSFELDAEQTKKMQAAHAAFWKAADAKDVAGARAVLAGLPSIPPGLFTYEETWLSLNE